MLTAVRRKLLTSELPHTHTHMDNVAIGKVTKLGGGGGGSNRNDHKLLKTNTQAGSLEEAAKPQKHPGARDFVTEAPIRFHMSSQSASKTSEYHKTSRSLEGGLFQPAREGGSSRHTFPRTV